MRSPKNSYICPVPPLLSCRPQSRRLFLHPFNGVLARLLIRDGLVRLKMSEASPSAAGLLADDGDAPVANENPAFIAWLNAG